MTLEHRQSGSGALIFVPETSDKEYVDSLKQARKNREELAKELEEIRALKEELKELVEENK